MTAVLLLLLAATPGSAPILVEAGATTTLGRHLCAVRGDERVVLQDGRLVVPEAATFALLKVSIGDCAAPSELSVQTTAPLARSPVRAVLHPDDGDLELVDRGLSRAVVWWRMGGGDWAGDVCTETSAEAGGGNTCELSVGRELARAALVAGGLEVLRLPPGAPRASPGDRVPEVWLRATTAGVDGGQATMDQLRVPDLRFVVQSPLVRSPSVEAWRDIVHVPLSLPGVAVAASCRPGLCWLTDEGVVDLVPPPTGDSVQITLKLKDRVLARQGDALSTTAVETLPVARCELRPLTMRVLGGTSDHLVSLILGDRCPTDLSDLAAESSPASGAWIERVAPEQHRVDVRLGTVPRRIDALELRLVRASTRGIVGLVRLGVRSNFSPTTVRLTDPELGELAVIPTNRSVRVTWASDDALVANGIEPVGVPGYYSLEHHADGVTIRGEARTAGSIALRFGYRTPSTGHSGELLTTFDSDLRFAVRPVNVPVSLSPDPGRLSKLAIVVCRDDAGLEKEIAPGELVSMPFSSRNSCRLKLDRSVLGLADGVQRIRVALSVSKPDGGSRDGGFSRVLVVSSSHDPLSISLASTGAMRAFDHLTVRLSHDDQPGHYLVDGEASSLPARTWQIVFGDQHLRLYGSATVPTGLYRVTSAADAGTLQFSAGALARLVVLGKEGKEFPFDLEFGVLGTNLSNRPNVSIVAGAGLTVPILNPQEIGQAAVGIHLWVEYAPTRPGDTFADHLAFIFGPSLSLGDFGTNL